MARDAGHSIAPQAAPDRRPSRQRPTAAAILALAALAAMLPPDPQAPPGLLPVALRWLPLALAAALFADAFARRGGVVLASLPLVAFALWSNLDMLPSAHSGLGVVAAAAAVGVLARAVLPDARLGSWIAAISGACLALGSLIVLQLPDEASFDAAHHLAPPLAHAVYLIGGLYLLATLRRRRASAQVADLCAAAVMGLAVLGIVGVAQGEPVILRLGTQSLPLLLQSSIALLLCALALSRLDQPRDPWALLSLATVGGMALLALVGEFLPDPGMRDAMAIEDPAGTTALHRRLPAVTAIAFLLAVAGMQAALLARARSRLLAFSWLAGVVMIGLALLVLAGHALDLREARELSAGNAMSPLAAVGLLLVGIGLSSLEGEDAWLHARREAWLPAAVAIAGMLLALCLWDAARDQERRFRAATDEAALSGVVKSLQTGLANRARAFRRVGQRLARRPEDIRLEGFVDDAGDYLDATSRLSLVAYYDAALTLREVASAPGRGEVAAWLAARRTDVERVLGEAAGVGEPIVGRALRRDDDDVSAFIGVPLIDEARVAGFLLLELELDDFVMAMLADMDPSAHVGVRMGEHLVHQQGPSPKRVLVGEADLYGTPWRVTYAAPESGETVRTSSLILGSGLLATLLLTIALRQSTLARLRRNEAERALAQKRQIVDSSRDVIGSLDPDGWFLEVNAACREVWGYTPEELVGRQYLDLVDPVARERVHAELVAVRQGRPPPPGSHDCLGRDGRRVTVEWSIDRSAELGRLVFVCRDITESRRIEAELDRMLTHDRVTGLIRHAGFEQSLQGEIDAGAGSIAVFFINLDHFHGINESLGRDAGDQALRAIAARLQGLGDGGLRVARYAGDEFGAFALDLGALAARALAERIRDLVSRPIEGEGFRIFLTASIGLSRYPRDGAGAGDLIRRAELAMKQVKSEGRDQIAEFSLEQMRELEERLTLGAKLRAAVERGELRLHYQPQFDARSGQPTGVEALLRWHSPTLGTVSPAQFVPVAESLGLMPELGRWVLDAACRQAREWRERGHRRVTVSVNVSALQMQRPDFVDQVQMALVRHRLPGSAIDLELTESALMENVDRVQSTLAALKALGVSLSLDDFGTGYSSLAYLRQFKLDKLKIDRSFVADLPGAEDAAVIARTIIAVAHQLRMRVSAEGVETEEQRRFLVESGCDELQGYLCGRPQPAADCEALFAAASGEPVGSPSGIA